MSRATIPVAALVAPVAVWLWHARQYGQWLIDDALITVAYVRSLAAGAGYAQAPGDPQVEGISNPLWAMLLWGLHRIGLFDNRATWAGISDIVLPLKLLALVFFVLTLLMVYMITRSVFGLGWRSWASLGTGDCCWRCHRTT